MELARQLLAVGLVLALLGAAVRMLRRGRAAAGEPRSRGGAVSGWPGAGWPGTGWLRAGRSPREWLRAAAGAKSNAVPAMQRVGRLPLTPQHTLHLIRIQGRELVVATHPQGCCVVENNRAALEARSGAGV